MTEERLPQKASGNAVNIELMYEILDEFKRALRNGVFNNAKALLLRMQTNMPGLKSSIQKFKNALTSIQEGVASEALSKAQAGLELKESLDEFEDNFRSFVSALSVDKPSFDEELQSRLTPDSLKVFSKDKDSLQRALLKSGVYVGYAPVLALAGPPFNPGKLQHAGIPAESFAGYCILKKQFVAGISLDYINAHLDTTVSGKKSKSKDTEQKSVLIDEFKEILTRRYRSLRLEDAAPPLSWYGAMWFWMVPASELQVWRDCTISPTKVGSVAIKKWSFPF